MVSKVKFPKSPTLTYNASVAGIIGGNSQMDVIRQLGISKPTLKAHLKKKDTTWALLTEKFIGESTSKDKQSKGKKVKSLPIKTPPTPLPPPTGDDPHDPNDPDLDPDEIDFDIPQQLKEMVKCSEYVCDHIEKASFGDAIKFYEKTKMIENEDKDFADDNAFLGNVESMLFQYKIIEAQSPALDVRVENPDLVGELK